MPVAKLMDNDIFSDFLRQFHQKAVEIKVPGLRAAAPSCPLVSYRDPALFNAESLRPDFYQRREVI